VTSRAGRQVTGSRAGRPRGLPSSPAARPRRRRLHP